MEKLGVPFTQNFNIQIGQPPNTRDRPPAAEVYEDAEYAKHVVLIQGHPNIRLVLMIGRFSLSGVDDFPFELLNCRPDEYEGEYTLVKDNAKTYVLVWSPYVIRAKICGPNTKEFRTLARSLAFSFMFGNNEYIADEGENWETVDPEDQQYQRLIYSWFRLGDINFEYEPAFDHRKPEDLNTIQFLLRVSS